MTSCGTRRATTSTPRPVPRRSAEEGNGQATLENWQSEFLQLFAFISLSALYIHKGSAESKDGTEKLEASLRRIEEHLGTLPPAPGAPGEEWKLPDTSLLAEDRVVS